MAKVWKRDELTDDCLIEMAGFIRSIAQTNTLPFHLVERARAIESRMPPLVESEAPHG